MASDAGWYSEDTATFGDRLASAREAAGLSQKALAKNIGVKPSTVDAWENDLSEPRANRLQMLSGVLSVSLGWLITGKGEGVDDPVVADPISNDLSEILTEMRVLRTRMVQSGERLGLLEKRLRKVMQGDA